MEFEANREREEENLLIQFSKGIISALKTPRMWVLKAKAHTFKVQEMG